MGQRDFKVEVNSAVLRWAREAAGYSLSDAARKLEVTESILVQWEAGKRMPTWQRLSRMATVYKRSVAALLLPQAPAEPALPTDFRRLPGRAAELSSRMRLVLRKARWLAQRAHQVERDLGVEPPPPVRPAKVTDDPEQFAAKARSQLGVDIEQQMSFRTVKAAFDRWRAAIEQQGVYVFHFPMPVSEALGFSIRENGNQAIVVNRSDVFLSRRVFTLFHEYGHLSLSRPGMCLPDEGAYAPSADAETFCNRFSAAVLIPRDEAKTFEHQLNSAGTHDAIKQLAARYRVSRYVVLGRMRSFGLIAAKEYEAIANRWRTAATGTIARRGGPGETTAKRCVSQRGARLVKSVLDAADRNLITTADAIRYLEVKLTDLTLLRARTRQASM